MYGPTRTWVLRTLVGGWALAAPTCRGVVVDTRLAEAAAAAEATQQAQSTSPDVMATGLDPVPPPAKPGPAGVLTFLGRTLGLDPNNPDHVVLSWSGVAAGASFEGSRVTARFVDANLPEPATTINNPLPDPRTNFYSVYVDGQQAADISVLHNANIDVVVADGLGAGRHSLWMVKKSEAWIGINGFLGFSLDANGSFFSPPLRPKRCIEVVGASVDTGYGVGGFSCSGSSAASQDVQKAWGNLVGQALEAEVVNLSYAGHGLEWSNNGRYPPGYSPAEYYLETEITAPGHPWDANQRAVSAVLFGLFDNDWFFLRGRPPPQAQFSSELLAFIDTIASLHPSAHVYLTLSNTFDPDAVASATTYLKDVVSRAQEAGNPRVHFVAFPPVSGAGCYGHPNAAQQALMQNAILPAIRADLGW